MPRGRGRGNSQGRLPPLFSRGAPAVSNQHSQSTSRSRSTSGAAPAPDFIDAGDDAESSISSLVSSPNRNVGLVPDEIEMRASAHVQPIVIESNDCPGGDNEVRDEMRSFDI